MLTQAYFENIQQHIINEVAESQNSVLVAVAWFTDRKIFDVLCSLSKSGKRVELLYMNDAINQNSGINYGLLQKYGGKVYPIGEGKENETLMHNKFCVIDGNTVITGSYNWSNKAQHNHENITVIKESLDLAEQFIAEFNAIITKQFGAPSANLPVDLGMICKRLETIKIVIQLQDEEDIAFQTNKLKKSLPATNQFLQTTNLYQVIAYIESRQYASAIREIELFINRLQGLIIYEDPELPALKLEIRALELQLSSLEDEKTEIDKLIHAFKIKHNQELGPIILQLLQLRKEKLKAQAANNPELQEDYEEAEQDYKDYQQTYDATAHTKQHHLDTAGLQQLKTNYRKASKLCHPDVVADEMKEQAEQMFKDLKEAYDLNDLVTVTRIMESLQQDTLFVAKSAKVTEKIMLHSVASSLRSKLTQIVQDIEAIKSTKTYRTITSISDWDEYFSYRKEKLMREIANLQQEEV